LWNWLEDCANELVNKKVNQNNLKDIISDNDNSKIIELYTIIKQYQKLIKIHTMNEDALKSLVEKISGSKEYLEALSTIAYTKEIDPIYLLFYFEKEKIKTSLENLFNKAEIKIKNEVYYDISVGRAWNIKFEIKQNNILICIELYRWNKEFKEITNPFIIGVNYGFIWDNNSNNIIDTLKKVLQDRGWNIQSNKYWITRKTVDNLIKEIK